MSTPTLEEDIARGLVLMGLIERYKAELKEITERLEARALKGPHVPLEDATREGRQFLARGQDVVLPVVITADELVKSFQDGSELHLALTGLATGKLEEFYKCSKVWAIRFKDGQEFRQKAAEILGEKAAAFITGCINRDKKGIPKNKIVIGWDRAQEAREEA